MEGLFGLAPVNTPVVLICPASDDSDIRLRDFSIGKSTKKVTCKEGSVRAAYMISV
jgi:hypothetical protein